MFAPKKTLPSPGHLAPLLALALFASPLRATDGVWTNATGNANWSATTSWSGGIIASGTDAIADFSTLDITAARTITVNASYTVGALKFADTTASHNWTLASSSTFALTLETSTGVAPTITVANQILVLSARLAGTQGFTLSGGGALRLTSTASTITGGITLLSGSELQFASGALGTNTVYFKENATLTWNGAQSQDVSAQIRIEDGVTATLATGANNVTLATALQTGALGTAALTKTGSGTLTLTAANTYTGLTKISVGRIALAGGDNRLATTGAISLGQGANSGVLQLGDATGASNQTTTSIATVGTGTTNAIVGGSTSVSTLTVSNSAAVTFAGLLGGAGANENNLALVKTGTALLTLSNTANTFTGGVTLSAGTLNFSAGALGSGTVTYAAASSLQWATGNTSDVSAQIRINDGVIATLDTNGNNVTLATAFQTGTLGTAALTKGGAGTLTLTAANTYTGNTRINNGRLILTGGDGRLSSATALQFGSGANSGVLQLGDASGASNQTVTGLSLTGNAITSLSNAIVGGSSAISTLTVSNTAAVTWAQMLGGSGTNENNLALVKSGTGTLTLSGTSSTFAGNVTVTAGILSITRAGALGTGAKTLTVSGGATAATLRLDGSSADISLGSAFSLSLGNDTPGAAALLSSAGSNLISGSIAAGGASGSRIRVTAGSLTLNGAITAAATAAGPVNVTFDVATSGSANGIISDHGGTVLSLTKEGTGTWALTAANTYTGATTVSAGQLTLTTAQTGGGAITVADGAALGLTLAAAGQTLHTSALTLGTSTGSTLYFNLGSFSNPAAALIATTAFSTGGTTALNISGTGLGVGVFDLITYTGPLGGAGFGGLTLGSLPARVTASLVNNTAASKVQLSISAFDVPKWTGALSSDWDVNDGTDPATGSGTVNWKETTSGTATRYLQFVGVVDSVRFDDSATGSTSVNLTTQLSPSSILVENTTKNYTFTGTGYLSGATTLLKQGAGSLTIANSGFNDFTGTTTLSAGTLILGDGVTAGVGTYGSGAIVNNAALVLNRPEDFFFANTLSGGGTLTQQGAGTAILSGNNAAFTGTITVSAGTLKLGSASALGDTTGGTLVSAGAALDVTGYTSVAESIRLSGGTLKVTSATTNRITAALTLSGGGTVDAASASALTLGGGITGSGGLLKTGLGTLILTADSSYTGGTTITQGVLQVGSTIATATGSLGSGDISLNADGTDTATLNIRRSDTALVIASSILTTAGTGTNAVIIDNGVAGVVTFSGANTFTGNVTINTGTLVITGSSALGSGAKTIRVAGGSIPSLQLDGSSGNITLGSNLSFALSSDGSVNTAGAISSVAGDNVINGTLSQINGGGGNARITVSSGTLTINGGIDASGATGNRTILLGGAATGIVNGIISDYNPAATSLVGVTKDGSGTWTLTGANTFTGAVTVSAGTLRIGSLSATGTAQPLGSASSAVLIGAATTSGTLEYTGGADATLARAITVNGAGGGIIRNSGGAVLTLGGTLTRVTNRALTFSGGAFIITGQLAGTASVSNIDGATVTLANTTNSFLGITYVFNGGTLRNGASEVLTDASSLVLGEAAGNTGGTYDLNGFNETIAGLSSAGTGVKTIINSAASGTSTLTISGAGAYDGVIQDGATAHTALTKGGTGTLTLSGTETYTGKTTVSGGTLALAGTASIQSSAWVQVNAGATLDVSALASPYTQSGSTALSGGGTITGPVVVSGGALISAGTSSSASNIATAGDGFGILTIHGDLTLAGGATALQPRALFQIGAATGNAVDPTLSANVLAYASTLSTSVDTLLISGALTLNAGSVLQVALSGYTPVYGDVFNLLDWSSVSLNGFDLSTDLALPTLADSSLQWNTDLFASAGLLYITASVPEPSRALLAALGLAALTLRRRRTGTRRV
ncbi:beta strand repeat-containing protein [Prosthecobacter fluviatilis]|uniref:Beta strand repeat-containing protein n=1 Tax=Prosthecobacter fluviatilis TaxID=445931 RepID=A0ABW0KXX5_9BACT